MRCDGCGDGSRRKDGVGGDGMCVSLCDGKLRDQRSGV
jgi:hypothetical protein